MKWQEVQHLKDEIFKRLVGVSKATFKVMLAQITPQQGITRRGRPPILAKEDELLMMLMYYREYRTFLHISITYGISETQCWRIINTVEEQLIKCKLFHLPGKKQLLYENAFEVLLIDVAESPIERPKKNNDTSILEKRKSIP